ncbi:MAG: NUDIX hydrolase [Microbacteriaceae bacterium]|nr:NUDIX hydrolase [Microbacteriaceae bacterium]
MSLNDSSLISGAISGADVGPVIAAGIVGWRMIDDVLTVLIITRGDRADVSLPKGKVDPGETPTEAAVRETREETGLAVGLGAPLGTTSYTMPGGREKLVYYWVAQVSPEAVEASTFVATAEVAAVHWLPIAEARAALSYARDREVLDRFAERVATDTHRTYAVISLRHGKAVAPGSWNGPDASRPLERSGTAQAQSSARAIAAYRPTKLISSTAVRCIATIDPLSVLSGLSVKTTDAISQDAHEAGLSKVHRVVGKRIAKRETAVLCSHGPVLPEIVDELFRAASKVPPNGPRRARTLNVGEFSVVHLARSATPPLIVAVEVHSPVISN